MSRRGRAGILIVGATGLAVLAGSALVFMQRGGRKGDGASKTGGAAGATSRDRGVNGKDYATLVEKALAKVQDKPLSSEEAAEWVSTLESLRSGYKKAGAGARKLAMAAVGRIIDRFGVEGAPANWGLSLLPSHDVLVAGLMDREPSVRAAALQEIGRLWVWMPGRSTIPAEDNVLTEWKQGFHAPAVRLLGDPVTESRSAAVACLAALPIDDLAAPAVPYLSDKDPNVRLVALTSFATRRSLVSEEDVLAMLYDSVPQVALAAEQVLKARGLTQEQIGLGRLIFHPRAELRLSAIPMLLPRTDIDTDVWLLHLSRDEDEKVRSKAVEALAGRESPEVKGRLIEMAQNDPSDSIRKTVGKLVPDAITTSSTSSLPPLPSSTSLRPKAN